MVFGNMGEDCGTGVAFSRNPATGENKIFGEYLMNAQGEDVVAGIRTPLPIETLKETDMEAYQDFVMYANKLEKHIKICKIWNLQLKMESYISYKLEMVKEQLQQHFK